VSRKWLSGVGSSRSRADVDGAALVVGAVDGAGWSSFSEMATPIAADTTANPASAMPRFDGFGASSGAAAGACAGAGASVHDAMSSGAKTSINSRSPRCLRTAAGYSGPPLRCAHRSIPCTISHAGVPFRYN